MRLKSRFTCTFTHTCCFYSGSTHPYTSNHFHLQIHPKLFYSYLSRISVRGSPTDVHNENIRTPVEAFNSMPYPVIRAVLDDHGLKYGKSVLQINQGSSAATIEYGKRLERIARRRAQGRRPPPDAGTRTRAFNAPAAFPPNPSVTGSVIGNRHPSRRSLCSLPHQIS